MCEPFGVEGKDAGRPTGLAPIGPFEDAAIGVEGRTDTPAILATDHKRSAHSVLQIVVEVAGWIG